MVTFKIVKRVNDQLRGRTEIVTKDIFTIGSNPNCDKVLQDELIEPHHAVIEFADGQFFLKDEGSITGILHNHILVAKPAILKNGDCIHLGTHRFSIALEQPDELTLIHENPPAFVAPFHQVERPSFKKWLVNVNLLLIVLCGLAFPALSYWKAKSSFWQPNPLHIVHAKCMCNQCHSPFKGITIENCGNCHQRESYKNLHSYPQVKHDCAACHLDHQGEKGTLTITALVDRDSWCIQCHKQFHKKTVQPLTVRSQTQQVSFLQKTFDHALHLEKDKTLQCYKCHKLNQEGKQDFERISYQLCLTCHQQRKIVTHGNFNNCLPCHQGNEKQLQITSAQILKRTGRSETVLKKITLGGGHALLKGTCRDCHLGKRVSLNLKVAESFTHGIHVRDTASQQDCLICHNSLLTSTPLGRWEGAETCGRCHTAERALAVATRDVEQAKLNFNHTQHLKAINSGQSQLPQGRKDCFICHTLVQGKFLPLPATTACTPCHQNHQNYGKNYRELPQCLACHPGIYKAASYGAAINVVQNYPTFSHRKPPHKYVDCKQCHPGMKQVGRGQTLSLDLTICNKCHDHGNKQTKEQNCSHCHGYHAFFKTGTNK